MTAPELKPCPFCGGEARMREDVSHSTACFVGCAVDDCFGELHWASTRAEAIYAWNTRAATPDIPAMLAEAEERGRKAEREACARVCEEWGAWNETAQAAAAAIRARGDA